MKHIVREHTYRYMAEHHEIKFRGEIADRIGISRQDFSMYFSGIRRVSDNVLNAISKYFDIKFEMVKNEHIFYVNTRISEWESSCEPQIGKKSRGKK